MGGSRSREATCGNAARPAVWRGSSAIMVPTPTRAAGHPGAVLANVRSRTVKGSGHPGEDRSAQPRTRSPPPVNDTSLRLRIPHVKTGALGGRERANLWMGFAITSRCKSGSGGELPRCLVCHHAVHEFASRVDRLQELRSVQPAERPLGASIKRLQYVRWRCAAAPVYRVTPSAASARCWTSAGLPVASTMWSRPASR
jgi:hypothetical protein